MRHPRWLNHWYANLAGYFWKHCPRCGQMFGGHEIGGTDHVTNNLGSVTCWRCPTDRTLMRNGEWRDGHFIERDGQTWQVIPLLTRRFGKDTPPA